MQETTKPAASGSILEDVKLCRKEIADLRKSMKDEVVHWLAKTIRKEQFDIAAFILEAMEIHGNSFYAMAADNPTRIFGNRACLAEIAPLIKIIQSYRRDIREAYIDAKCAMKDGRLEQMATLSEIRERTVKKIERLEREIGTDNFDEGKETIRSNEVVVSTLRAESQQIRSA